MVRLSEPDGPADHSIGPKDARVTLVEYGSYDCPHCFQALRIVLNVMKKHDGQVRLQVHDDGVGLPVGLHDESPSTLGLQLVRMLAKQLGAAVSFASSGGTSVDVRMPVGAGPRLVSDRR